MVASIPVIVTVAQAVDARWTPSSDDGMIALRAFDVLSTHPPLVGQYSQASTLIEHPAYSLGPMLYWLLAIPAHLGASALVVTIGLVNVLAIVGIVVLSARRGGPLLAVIAALATLMMYRALPVEVPYEVWNCWAGVYPFTLLIFLAWSLACGDYRLLPLFAVVASFVMQVHFTYLLPASAVVIAALGGLALWSRAAARPPLKRWAIAAALVTLVCWSAPLADQIAHRPGNLVLAARLATDDHETFGTRVGWHMTARAIGVVPTWARRAPNTFQRLGEPVAGLPLHTAVIAVLVLAALVAALVVALRRRRLDLTATLAISLLLCLCMVAVGTSVPTGNLGAAAFTYAFTWLVPAGMFVWLTLAWSFWELAGLARRVPRRIAERGRAVPAVASLGVVAVLAAALTDRWSEDPGDRLPPGLKDYALIRSVTARATEPLRDSPGVRISVPVTVENSLTFQSSILYALRRDGVPVSLPQRLVTEAGNHYKAGRGRDGDVLLIGDAKTTIPPAADVLVREPQVTVATLPAGVPGER